jgi:hypothetical protein
MKTVEFLESEMQKVVYIAKSNKVKFDELLKQAKEMEKQKQYEFAIRFAVWLSINCEQSTSKDGWWVYKSKWLTTDELLKIYKNENTI